MYLYLIIIIILVEILIGNSGNIMPDIGHPPVISACLARGSDYRFNRENKGCYKLQNYGPPACPHFSLQFKEENSIYGKCLCQKEFGYVYASGACHLIYTQGPCELSQRLIPLDDGDTGVCADDPCGIYIRDREIATFVLWKDGVCYYEYSQGPCPDGHRIIHKGKWEAECEKNYVYENGFRYPLNASQETPCCFGGAFTAGASSCPPGEVNDGQGGCRRALSSISVCRDGERWHPISRKCLS